jgi:hypothetical protein
VLSLILFMPPRGEDNKGWLDAMTAGGLIIGLYHLKVTYFAAAMAELAVALLLCRHVRSHRRKWLAVGSLATLNAIAPYNWPYLADILASLETGAAQTDLVEICLRLTNNVAELSLMVAVLVIALGRWSSRQASLRLPAAVGLLIVVTIAVLSQNTQARGLGLSIVAAFLLYDHFRGGTETGQRPAALWVLLALLVFPAALVAKHTMSLVGYHIHATHGASFFEVDRTALRGLAVPAQPEGLLEAFNSRRADPVLLDRARSVKLDEERISQFEYVQTILEAAALLDGPTMEPGAVVLLDEVNPLPFVTGRPPPRGGSLWLALEFAWQSAEATLSDARYVLIPRFSINRDVTDKALELYGAYLAKHFPRRTETRSWILLSRRHGG